VFELLNHVLNMYPDAYQVSRKVRNEPGTIFTVSGLSGLSMTIFKKAAPEKDAAFLISLQSVRLLLGRGEISRI
jgi:hypothetical protein